jgi:peptidoglycan/xylan/chitin deacetylase (PgdA/CDA1 family)
MVAGWLPGPLRVRLRLLRAVAAGWVTRFSGRRSGLALMYHAVGEPPGDPSRELVPAHATTLFEAQLRHLERHYRVVPASELLAAAAGRRRGGRLPVAITFDDDLESHRSVAMPVLKRMRLPATFFLSGASLSRPSDFWWERLQRAIDRGVDVTPALAAAPAAARAASAVAEQPGAIHELAMAIQLLPPARRDEVSGALASLAGSGPSQAGLRAEDVQALADAGFEVGFHTLRHDYLPGLGDSELAAAMRDGGGELERVAGPVRSIAYPHGGADRRVADAAREAGYSYGFTGSGEAVRPETDPLLIGRIEPSFESVGHFAIQVSRALRGASW